jgi:hypothetical protein
VIIPAGAGLIRNGKKITPQKTAARNIFIRRSAGLIFAVSDMHITSLFDIR